MLNPQTEETPNASNTAPTQEAVNEMAQKNAAQNPVQFALYFFKQNYPLFRAGLSTLNKKDLQRMCEAIVGFPLEIEDPKFYNKNGQAVFRTANSLLEMKAILRMAVQLDDQATKQTNVENNTNTEEGKQ